MCGDGGHGGDAIIRLGTPRRDGEGLRLGTVRRSPQDERQWHAFIGKFRAEMRQPQAALSHQTNLSLGCYCDDETRCHRSLLRELLLARGASLA